MKKKDVTLLVIGSAGEEGLSPIQIQKSLFLIGQSHLPALPSDFYEFYAYNYGPFCEEVYSDADTLVEEGMVFNKPVSGQNWSIYVIAPKGQDRAEAIRSKNDIGDLAQHIKEIVAWVSALTFSELLRAIYAKYPQYSEKSVFQG
ncbi:MAG: hypothetical protein E3J92_01650 [Dehalococcoidia bacterium]|nr:MAG: hypothetical protein E3J92_01650 [Dehalococcoidia bacterium]